MRGILVLALAVFVAAETRYDGFKVLRIEPLEILDSTWLSDIESKVEFWSNVPGRPVDIMVPPALEDEIVLFLRSKKLDFSLMIGDVQAVIDGQRSTMRSRTTTQGLADFKYDQYNTYDQINQWVSDMAAEHSDVVTKFTVTQSYEKRLIDGIKISSGGNNKPVIWFEGGIHAREWISPATVMLISKFLVEDLKNGDPQVVKLVNYFDFYIVPSLNVDGYAFTWSDDRLWRKTRRPNPGYGCIGTDPNRNWPYMWGGSGTSPWPCSITYHGGKALSEVEVKGVVDFLTNLSVGNEIRMFIDWHSYSQLWMAPWSFSSSEQNPVDWLDQSNLGQAAVQALEEVHGTTFVSGMSAKLLYEASGASCDWGYAVLGAKYSYVVELRDKGNYGFLLPEDQIMASGEEAYKATLAAVEYAMNN
ncbi:carboxypeptidase B-like isoform X2 [Asterias rubens]|uniref:carboxypeptidase B-like isoform X2 n=1 Tax=Asterias rubens TaxID=7604 RepID=UPI0014559B6F|nr:carboxypeptidase B-like isoform X2 [Asterias rubens]